jgi:hypothetical protein
VLIQTATLNSREPVRVVPGCTASGRLKSKALPHHAPDAGSNTEELKAVMKSRDVLGTAAATSASELPALTPNP